MTVKELFQRINVFSKTDYLKNIVGQAGIVFVAQLIPLLFSPLISRYYDENALAELTGLVSLGSLLLVFSSFKLSSAIVLEKDDHKARQLVILIFFINLFMIVLISLLLYLFKDFFVKSFKVDNVIFLVPVFVFSFSIFGTMDGWFVRQKKFRNKALAKIVEAVSYLIFSFSLYFVIGGNEYGLAVGKILGIALAALFLVKYAKFKVPKYNFKDLQHLLIKYREFPLHNMPSNFINVISLQIVVIFLGFFYSKAEVGYFGLANMVVLTPISFVSQAIGSIFYQKIVEAVHMNNYRQVRSTYLKTLFLLLAISVPGFIILRFFGETLIPIIFGSNWVLSGKIVRDLSWVFMIQIVVGPISGVILIALGKIKLNAIWQYSRFFFMTMALLTMVYILKVDFINFIKGYSYCVVISYLVYLLVINNVVNSKTNS